MRVVSGRGSLHDRSMQSTLQRERERVVRAHVDAEQRGDWEAALATFDQPRYEVTATGEVHEGADGVMRFYRESARAFPEMTFETRALYHGEPVVIHEVVLEAVQHGAWRGLPATGRRVRYAMLNVFVFDDDRLVCERMYFDLMTPMRQLGIAHDVRSAWGRFAIAASHPLTIGRSMLRAAAGLPRRLGRDRALAGRRSD
jgi:steroid delta-isomerase-like uncharacterized protein